VTPWVAASASLNFTGDSFSPEGYFSHRKTFATPLVVAAAVTAMQQMWPLHETEAGGA